MGIPDAPWIRDAENNGIEYAEPPVCPVCGEECETLYEDRDTSYINGCNKCIREVDAWEWQAQKEEDERMEER